MGKKNVKPVLNKPTLVLINNKDECFPATTILLIKTSSMWKQFQGIN